MNGKPRVAVIGAGISGVGMLRELDRRGLQVRCFERSAEVGGLWVYDEHGEPRTAYRSLHTKTPRERMRYPDLPMQPGPSRFPSHDEVATYMNRYVDEFDLRRHIQFGAEVKQVEEHNGGWRVTLSGGELAEFDAVVIANGHHSEPRFPEVAYPGTFTGVQLHSHYYQNSSQYAGKRVLVVGAGNSAVDIAIDTSWISERTFISIRSGIHIIPEMIFGKPNGYVLGMTASWAPRRLRQAAFTQLLRVIHGRYSEYGLAEPEHGLFQQHPTVSDSLLARISHGRVVPKPGIERLDGDGVVFTDGSRETFDAIIWSTGYKVDLPFMDDPRVRWTDSDIPLYLHIFPPGVSGLYMCGLLQPLGPVMWVVAAQAKLIAAHLLGEYTLPPVEEMEAEIAKERVHREHRFLGSTRYRLEVDGPSYVKALERAPGGRRSKLLRRAG